MYISQDLQDSQGLLLLNPKKSPFSAFSHLITTQVAHLLFLSNTVMTAFYKQYCNYIAQAVYVELFHSQKSNNATTNKGFGVF